MAILLNQGLFLGTLGTDTGVEVATTIASTRLIDGLVATKTADKEVWVNGELTYTIKITNESGEDYKNVTLTDSLDISLIDLVPNSVYVDGTQTAYTYASGVLSINLSSIDDGSEITIIFKVTRK